MLNTILKIPREILKGLNKWRDMWCSFIGKLNIVKK